MHPNRPRSLSDLMPGLTKDVFGRKNMLFGKMVAKWAEVAGPEISAKTMPLDLKFLKKTGNEANQAVLHLGVQPGFALEFSYQKALLIERLNVFFGYAAIKDIKIVQNSEIMAGKARTAPKTRLVTAQEESGIEAIVSKIQENDLQIALKNLGKAIISRTKKD